MLFQNAAYSSCNIGYPSEIPVELKSHVISLGGRYLARVESKNGFGGISHPISQQAPERSAQK